MNPLGLLAGLVVKPIPELLVELAGYYDQSDDPANPRVPRVTLHLRSGRDLSGRIVKLGQDPTFGQTILMHVVGEDDRNADLTALYVPASTVEAVTVLKADQFADLLSDGALSGPTSNVAPPSRLEILRSADELSKALTKTRGITLKPEIEESAELTPEALRSLAVLVKESFAVLTDIAADKTGKESLSGVRGVLIANGEKPSVKLTNRRLEIVAALSQGRAGRLSKAELTSTLSSVL